MEKEEGEEGTERVRWTNREMSSVRGQRKLESSVDRNEENGC